VKSKKNPENKKHFLLAIVDQKKFQTGEIQTKTAKSKYKTCETKQ
jgi:hypothetical protein